MEEEDKGILHSMPLPEMFWTTSVLPEHILTYLVFLMSACCFFPCIYIHFPVSKCVLHDGVHSEITTQRYKLKKQQLYWAASMWTAHPDTQQTEPPATGSGAGQAWLASRCSRSMKTSSASSSQPLPPSLSQSQPPASQSLWIQESVTDDTFSDTYVHIHKHI